jgi:hypothetical protein
MDEIHALRDQSGADLTCLILQSTDTTSAGLGYMLASPGENYNPLFGFCVVQYAYVTSQETVTHEFRRLNKSVCVPDLYVAETPATLRVELEDAVAEFRKKYASMESTSVGSVSSHRRWRGRSRHPS